jgi:hypothetical protein
MDWSKTKFFGVNISRFVVLYGVSSILIATVILMGFLAEGTQQFSELAKAFLHGQANFLHPIGGLGEDPVFYKNKIYWSDGPFPSLVLVPFVGLFEIFHHFFYQGYIEWAFVLGTIYFVYKLARILKYSQEDSFVLTLAFTLGSVFAGVVIVSSSWLFAQVLTTFLIFWSLYEFYTRKRWLLIGFICGAILLTRVTAAPIVIFYVLELLSIIPLKKKNITPYLKLILPVLLCAYLIGLYNYVRFQNPFNGGVGYQLLYPDSSISRSYGVFSLVHIPSNLYSLLLRAPVPVLKSNASWTLKFPYIRNNVYGMSIFITSPYLIYLFTQKWSSFNKSMRNLLIATAFSMLFVLTYYGLGLQQYGTRYSLDYLPELFLLFMYLYRRKNKTISNGMKFLMIASGIFNMYMLIPYVTRG